MPLVLADRVRDTTTTTGTGTVTLSGTAPTGYQNFSVIGNGNTTYYTINAGSQWEVGIGTYSSTGPTLSRNTVLASSNGGALVNFAAGIKDVFITYPAEKAVTDDYGVALAATTATNIAGGAAGSIPYQTAANTTALLAAGTGVLIGGTTPSYTMSPSLTQVTVAADPTTNLQVATKQYVDTIAASGVTYHTPVKYEAPAPLTATYNNGSSGVGATLTNAGTLAAFAPDGVVASVNDRILIYTQADPVQNGVYTVTTVGSGSVAWVLTRATDANTYGLKSPNALGEGDAFFVTSGNTGAGETYVCNTSGTITFGTTPITFVQVSSAQVYSAGTGLTLTGTVFSLTAPVATTLGGTGLTSFTSGGAVYATSSSTLTTGTLPATSGGTGLSSYTAGDLLYATSSTTVGTLADVATGNALLSGGVGADPAWGKVGLTTHVTGTLPVANGGTGATSLTGYLVGNGTSAFTATATIPTSALSGTISLTTQVSGTLGAGNGGTGLSSYTVGDLLYASGTTTLASLPDVATGNALISGGVSNAPLWGKIGLTTHVSGTLPVSNGGSGATTLTGYLKGNGTSAFTASATIPAGDITGAALTEIDDVNVTMTLGGSPSTALLAATSMTLGWTGQLAVSRGGTGNSTLASGYLLKGNGVSPTSASVIYDDGTNVGIGTASPGARLQVGGSTAASQLRIYGGAAGSTSPELQLYGASSDHNWTLVGNHSTALTFNKGTFGNVGAELMRLTTGGNLLVGTTVNYSRLTVSNGNSTRSGITISDANTASLMMFAGASSNAVIAIDTNSLVFKTGATAGQDNGTDRLTISSAGNVTANVDFRAPIFYDSNNTGYFLDPASGSFLNRVVLDNGFGAQADGQANDPYGFVSVTRGTGSNFSYYGLTRAGNLGMGMGIDTLNNFWVGGTTAGYNGTRSSVWFQSDTSGNVTAAGSFRAPIFFDSNNTAFYLDPAGNSILSTLRASNIQFPSGTVAINLDNSSYSIFRSPDGGIRMYLGGADPANYYDNDAHIFRNRATTQIASITGSGVFAPIFYDSQNTFYYVDPGSTSNMNVLQLHGSIPMINGVSPPNSAIRLTPNLHLNAGSGSAVILNWDNGTTSGLTFRIGNGAGSDVFYVFANGDTYAPIIYDINNTGYYLNPNGASRTRNTEVAAGHSDTQIRLTALAAEMGSGQQSAMTWWVSEPNVSWNDGGFGFNVTNNGGTPNGFARLNTSFGQAYTRYTTSGDMIFYCTNTSGTRSTVMQLYPTNVVEVFNQIRAPIYYDSNNTAFYLDANSTGTSLNVAGTIVAAGNVTAYSDIRVKDNVEQIGGALDRLQAIRGVTYTRNDLEDKERRYAGVIAQEIEQVLPEAVFDNGDRKAVDYNATIGLLIEAIKELRAEVAELKGK